LGRVLWITGTFGEAEALLMQAADTRRRLLGRHPDLALTLLELARIADRRGDGGRADELFAEALSIQRETLGDAHADVASTLDAFGLSLWNRGEVDAAEPLLRESVAVHRATRGDHTLTAVAMNNLALVLMDRSDYGSAEAMLRDALDMEARR